MTTTEPLCPLCLDGLAPESEKLDWFDEPVLYFGEDSQCSRCGRPITPEGLAVSIAERIKDIRTVHEVGRNGVIIHQYIAEITLLEPDNDFSWRESRSETPDFLLNTLLRLKNQCESPDERVVTPIAALLRWNRKAAARRFRRWVKEHDNPLQIHDPALATLAQETMDAAPADEIDISRLIDDTVSNKNGHLDDLYYYERRKAEGPVLIVRELPASTRKLILEANEAYRWGLCRATIAICRAILEDTLRRIVATNPNSVASPIDQEDLHVLINSMSNTFLTPEEKTIALRIKERGNQALHEGDARFSESQAYAVLFHTTTLVRLLATRTAQLPIDSET